MIAPPDPRWPNGHDPRWPGHDPRWPIQPHQGGWWGWRDPHPVRDNQLGWRMPSGGQPAANNLALLRWLGWRWWKAALLSLAALMVVVVVEGGPGPALAHHFSGWLWIVRQFG